MSCTVPSPPTPMTSSASPRSPCISSSACPVWRDGRTFTCKPMDSKAGMIICFTDFSAFLVPAKGL